MIIFLADMYFRLPWFCYCVGPYKRDQMMIFLADLFPRRNSIMSTVSIIGEIILKKQFYETSVGKRYVNDNGPTKTKRNRPRNF